MWQYSAATFRGTKTAPKPGDFVTVQLHNPDAPEPDQYRYLTWTFDGKKTRAAFITMVRSEVANTIAELNRSLTEYDMTADFTP